MDDDKTGLRRLAKIAFSQAKGRLDAAATSRVLQEIGKTYLKSAATRRLRLSPEGLSLATPGPAESCASGVGKGLEPIAGARCEP